jgi:hypothetical protein
MKKTFSLKDPSKADARVLEAIKQDVRKYVKRERRKALSTGVDFWDFNCQLGLDQAPPKALHLAELIPAIEAATQTEGTTSIYVEIVAKPGHRTKKPVPEALAIDGNPSVPLTPSAEPAPSIEQIAD